MLLEGSHVLLTGATGALGTPLAGELRAAGARLTVSARPGAGLTALADHLGATAAPADLTRPGEAAALVAAAEATGGPLDVVVAGAGAEAVGRLGEVAPADVERALALNLRAPVDLVQAALPGLLARGRGLVVLVSSVAGSAAVPGLGVYGATKAAGELFLRAACARHQMTGIVLRPGPIVGPPAFASGPLHTPETLSRMVRSATGGETITVTRGEGRQFSDVSTVASAVRLLTREESPHATCLCVDRELITWERVARLVVECLASPSRVEVLPSDSAAPIPHFRTERIEGLLGGPTNAEAALMEHIRQLATVRSAT